MAANYFFVFLAFILDGVINMIFPVKFAFNTMYFVPCLGFCALVLTVRKMEKLDSLLLAIIAGMFYDFFYANTPFLYLIIFFLLCLITRLWVKQISDSLIETILLCISTIFIRELMVYFYMHISNQSALSFNEWLVNRMFLTLLINGILVTLLVFMSSLKDEYLRRKDIKQRKEEKLPWMR